MLNRRSKALFYFVAGPLMWANALIYRVFRTPAGANIKVHLGPGQRNYLEGWLNVDANMFTGRCDLWLDLRHALPFRDGTISAIYSHHVVEHLPDLPKHFRDVYRCLKPGGVYRVGVPNADSAIQKFIEQDKSWFGDFPGKRQSIGGRLDNFLLCRNEHMAIITNSYMRELLHEAGFKELIQAMPVKETRFPGLFQECLSLEWESNFDCPHTLLFEAVK